MKFVFKAKNKEGQVQEGTIEAASNEAAASVLQKNGLFPIKIAKEAEASELTKVVLKYYERVTEKELVVFFRQLAILIEARVPIVAALMAIGEQTANQYFKRVLQEIVNDIDDGVPLSDAMAQHSTVFSPLAINIIKAGETSGNLKKSVDYVADNIEKNYILVSRIRSAMLYPGIVMVVFFLVGFVTVSFILPKLTDVIKSIGATIPWYTQIVISVGDFMRTYWWAVAIIILGFVSGVLYYIKTPAGRKEFDEIKIKLPIVGKLYSGVYVARFAENLAVLLSGGIPIIRALTIVSSVINNSVYEAIILRTAEQVKIGGNMSDVLKKSPLIPPVVSHMIKIGEESGQIDTVLRHISKFYDQETEMATKNLSALIEPILMVIIGIGVGFMAVAILLPIYDVASQIK
jgi:type IV pilus assembly protein PilC